jgi:hypothetical protein
MTTAKKSQIQKFRDKARADLFLDFLTNGSELPCGSKRVRQKFVPAAAQLPAGPVNIGFPER